MSDHSFDHKREGAPRQESALEKKPDASISKNSFELKQAGTALADIKTERALMGCLLSNPADVLPIIKESGLSNCQFADQRNFEILGRVLQAESQSEILEPMSVFRYLTGKGIPHGDLSELTTEASLGTAPGTIKHWCARIKEAAGSRRTTSAFERLTERLKSGEKLETVLAEAEECINTTKQQLGPIKTHETRIVELFERSSILSTLLSEVELPPRRPVVGDWLYEADLLFIFARRGLGKTWLSLALACAIASKNQFGPYAVHTNLPVLYIDGEMPCETVQQRIAGLGASEALSVLNHEVLFHKTGMALNLTDPVSQSAVTQHCVNNGFKLLVLDNLSCLFSGVKENDADAWEAILPWLLELRRLQIAVLIVAHSGRDGQNMRGTSRREDAAFAVIRLDEVPDDGEQRNGARFVMRFTKNRNSATDLGATE